MLKSTGHVFQLVYSLSMSNRHAVKKGITRPPKRQRLNTSGAYHDRLPLEDDFEVVHARETRLTANRRIPVETQRSPLKGRTSWVVGDSWAPEDSTEYGLDQGGEWYDVQLETHVMEDSAPPLPPKKQTKPKQSRVSVSHLYHSVMQLAHQL